MTAPDLYAVLGVPQSATADELTAAYRRRARLTHPDAGGDAIAFRAVDRAYEILSDPGLRAGYDAVLNEGTQVQAAEPGQAESVQPEPEPAAEGQQFGRSNRPNANYFSSSGQGMVDLGQIRWAAPFTVATKDLADSQDRRVRIIPGRWWWTVQAGSWVLLAAWCVGGVWVGPAHVATFGATLAVRLWMVGWELVVLLVAAQAVRARWSVFIVAAVCFAWPAYTRLDLVWSWVVFAWLAGAVFLPMLRASTCRPLWPMRLLRAGNVVGEPRWGSADTAAVAAQLTVIPAVHILHRVGPAEHAIVLDRKVAFIGGPEDIQTVAGGCPAKAWPRTITRDPQRAVDHIGSWLLADTDGWTINRWALAAIANLRKRTSQL